MDKRVLAIWIICLFSLNLNAEDSKFQQITSDWSVGQVVATGGIIPRNKYWAKIDRHFLGLTPEGYFKVQEFYIDIGAPFHYKKYAEGTPYTAPYNLINKEDVTHFQGDDRSENNKQYTPSIHGQYIRYCDNGKMDYKGQYDHGKKTGYWYYYSGDQVYLTRLYGNDKLIEEKRDR